MMGVTAELEVNAILLCLFQMIGLMVEEDGKILLAVDDLRRCRIVCICLGYDFSDGFTMKVGAVVSSDDDEIPHLSILVTLIADSYDAVS